jgi:hypothetical protein
MVIRRSCAQAGTQSMKIAGKYNMLADGRRFAARPGAPLIARPFTSDPAVGSVATNPRWVVAFGYPLYGWEWSTDSQRRATRTPTLLNLAVFLLGETARRAGHPLHRPVRRLPRHGARIFDVRPGWVVGVQARNLKRRRI